MSKENNKVKVEYYFEGRLTGLKTANGKYYASFKSDFYGKKEDETDVMLAKKDDNTFIAIAEELECNNDEFMFLSSNLNRKFRVAYTINNKFLAELLKEEILCFLTKRERVVHATHEETSNGINIEDDGGKTICTITNNLTGIQENSRITKLELVL